MQVVTRHLKSAQELVIENHFVRSWNPLGLVGELGLHSSFRMEKRQLCKADFKIE